MRSAERIIEALPVRIQAATLSGAGPTTYAASTAGRIEQESHLGPCPSCGEAKRTLATCGDYTTQPNEPAEAARLARIHARYGRGEHLHARCSSCGFVTMQLKESAFNRYVGERTR